MGPCGSARRSRSVLSGSTLVPYHMSTDLTSVARARTRAQLRRDGSPARPSPSRQLPQPGIDAAMRAARSATGSAFPRCVCRCPPQRLGCPRRLAPRAWPQMSSIAAAAAPARKLTMEPGHDARARKSMRSVSTYIQRNLISPFSARSEQIENRRLWLHWVPDRPTSG